MALLLDPARLVSLVIASSLFARTLSQTCWYPDGQTIAPGDTPCSNATHTACCNPSSFCMANGFCFDHGTVSRGSCTDRSWGSSCAPDCRGADQGCDPAMGCAVMTCNVALNQFTCSNPANCATGTDIFSMSDGSNQIVLRAAQVANLQGGDRSNATAVALSPDQVLNVTAAAANSSSTSRGDGTKPDEATATVTVTAGAGARAGAGKYTAGDMAGVGVGIGLPFLLALVAAGVVISRHNRKLKAQSAMTAHMEQQYQGSMGYAPGGTAGTHYATHSGQQSKLQEQVRELDNQNMRVEIGTRGNMRHEMGGGR